jgi:hypothetical protein
MSTKKIEAWKANIAGDKSIFVATNVKAIHPVVDQMVRNLLEIDLIQYVRVSKDDLQASSDVKVKGRTKVPISTHGHPTAVGVHVILNILPNEVHFFEITSAVKGYGEKMVQAVLKSIPDDWRAAVAMDISEGFWDKMVDKYDNIEIL